MSDILNFEHLKFQVRKDATQEEREKGRDKKIGDNVNEILKVYKL